VKRLYYSFGLGLTYQKILDCGWIGLSFKKSGLIWIAKYESAHLWSTLVCSLVSVL